MLLCVGTDEGKQIRDEYIVRGERDTFLRDNGGQIRKPRSRDEEKGRRNEKYDLTWIVLDEIHIINIKRERKRGSERCSSAK